MNVLPACMDTICMTAGFPETGFTDGCMGAGNRTQVLRRGKKILLTTKFQPQSSVLVRTIFHYNVCVKK